MTHCSSNWVCLVPLNGTCSFHLFFLHIHGAAARNKLCLYTDLPLLLISCLPPEAFPKLLPILPSLSSSLWIATLNLLFSQLVFILWGHCCLPVYLLPPATCQLLGPDNNLKYELSQPEISQLFPSVNPSWCSDLQGLTTQNWIAGRPDREC